MYCESDVTSSATGTYMAVIISIPLDTVYLMASYSSLPYISDSFGRSILENGPIMNDVVDDMRSAKLYMPKRERFISIQKNKIATDDIIKSAISTLMSIAIVKIPVVIDNNNKSIKIISIEEYRNLEEDRRKMKETEENFMKVQGAMDSWGNDVGKYVSSQLKSGNPDTLVRNAVMSEAKRIMAENAKEGLDRRIDGISNLLLMGAQALKGLKVDHTLSVGVLELESITKKRLSFKVSDVIKCILDKKR